MKRANRSAKWLSVLTELDDHTNSPLVDLVAFATASLEIVRPGVPPVTLHGPLKPRPRSKDRGCCRCGRVSARISWSIYGPPILFEPLQKQLLVPPVLPVFNYLLEFKVSRQRPRVFESRRPRHASQWLTWVYMRPNRGPFFTSTKPPQPAE